MAEIHNIQLADLLLDQENARLGDPQASQPATYISLTQQATPRALLTLCAHVVENGLDPLSLTAVVATGDKRRKYRVLEGNRRILALKALETPAIVTGKKIMSAAEERKLAGLSQRYHKDPITTVSCVLFDTEDSAVDWIVLRHTGANDGAGLKEWGSTEKERFLLRHGRTQKRTTALQILEFVEQKTGKIDGPGQPKIATTVTRMMSNPEIRAAHGLDMVGGELVALYPADVIAPALRALVEDLTSKKLKVAQVYDREARVAYAEALKKTSPLDETKRLPTPVGLADLAAGKSTPVPVKPRRARKPTAAPELTTIVPPDCVMNPSQPRLNAVYDELCRLDISSFPNAGAVLLRVFLELSVDHEIMRLKLMPENQMLGMKLSIRLTKLAQALADSQRIPEQLRRAIVQIADSQSVIAASTMGFNQYVHNEFVHPAPKDLQTAWMQLQPFLVEITT